jgi:outer membrane lipoprotein SlyB
MNLKDTLTSTPAFRARAKIPPHKRKHQWLMTALGLAIIAATVYVRVQLWPDMHWLGVAAGCYAGGFVASKQLMVDLGKSFAQAIGGIVGALAGKKDA